MFWDVSCNCILSINIILFLKLNCTVEKQPKPCSIQVTLCRTNIYCFINSALCIMLYALKARTLTSQLTTLYEFIFLLLARSVMLSALYLMLSIQPLKFFPPLELGFPLEGIPPKVNCCKRSNMIK